jgi:arylsulfatase A-like enzyme
VAAAAIVAGIAEGVVYGDGALLVAASAGFAAWYMLPIGLAIALVARGLWHAWRPGEIAERLVEDTGGAPRLVAWLSYLLVGVCVLSTAAFNSVKLMSARSTEPNVVALVTAVVSVVFATALAALSRPAVDAIAAAARKLDARLALTPSRVIGSFGIAALIVMVASWKISFQPRLGHLDLGLLMYFAVFITVATGGHFVAQLGPVQRWFAPAAIATALIASLLVGTAVYVRHWRPFLMLDLWATVPVGGLAVDASYDLEDMRSDLRLTEIAPVERAGAEHPDIVLITIDTVRADHTPPYGGKAKMPALARLARRSAVFEWAFSSGNTTRRSLPVIASGLGPRRVRGRVAGWALRLDPRHITVAERLRAAGYDTAGYFCCRSQFGAEHELGLIRGIEDVTIEWEGAELAKMARELLVDREKQTDRSPLFLWLHLIEPHGWEKRYPSKTHGRKPGPRYDKALAATDTALSPLFTYLGSDLRKDRTVVIVTSDHGEGLGDHGKRHHSSSLFNAQIRVPLLVTGKGIEHRRIEQPVSLVDLAPTILDLAGYVPPAYPEVDGVSLVPLLSGAVEPKLENGVAFAHQIADRSVKDDLRAVVAGNYKLIVQTGNKPLLFDIRDDPKEQNNLAKDKPDVVQRLEKLIEQRRLDDQVSPFQRP